jgi:hypothetical protein
MTGLCGKMGGKEAASRSSVKDKRRNGTFATRRFFSSVSQLDTCHPDRREGSPSHFLQLP